jgi:hypothetical protein
VADRKPPRLAADEAETLLTLLRFQRESLIRKVADLDEGDARRALVPTGISLAWLVKHLTRAEVTWVLRRFAALGVDLPDDEVRAADTVAALVDAYRSTSSLVDQVIVSAASLDEVCHGLEDDEPGNLRWVLAHLLEETARHAGHADIIRELIDGQTGR